MTLFGWFWLVSGQGQEYVDHFIEIFTNLVSILLQNYFASKQRKRQTE